MGTLFNREPVMFMAVIQAIIALVLSFGVHLTTEQVGAILAVSAAILAFITRTQVSPVSKGGPNG